MASPRNLREGYKKGFRARPAALRVDFLSVLAQGTPERRRESGQGFLFTSPLSPEQVPVAIRAATPRVSAEPPRGGREAHREPGMRRRLIGLPLFGTYIAASALPIALLGAGLAHLYDTQMHRRALDEVATEAGAISTAGIEPVLDGRSLREPLSASERSRLERRTAPLLASGDVMRLRLRDVTGAVVFDAAHPNEPPHGEADDEVEKAAAGHIVRKLTHLNADEVDAGNHVGAPAVEAYVPLHSTAPARNIVGVLEIYLPFAPVVHSFAASDRAMLELLALCLFALWLALAAISWSVARRLRHSADVNEYLALHDALTGLPNRTLFVDRAEHAIASARRAQETVGIAIIDLDRFKEVNDALGHDNGDAYLCQIAARLTSVLRAGDTVARLGGDEFGLVLPNVDPASARHVLDRVAEAITADAEIGGVPVSSEASIGIAFAPLHSSDVGNLLQFADLAMYTAKQARSAIVEYTPNLVHYSPERLGLASELRRAIRGDELLLFYQPKLDLRTGRIVSVEALLRWQHPTRGLVMPAEFIDVAESTGVIDGLTEWVLDHAVGQLAQWHAAGLDLRVAVNVSARNLRNETLPESVLALLARHGVEPGDLEIEITETALIADPTRAINVIRRLHDRGVRVSLDDFGQGYTSLAQLGRVPITELKIDRGFVANMLTSDEDRTIVNTVIELGHNLGLEVVAEGAENRDIIDALVEMGCDTAQGWGITAAMHPDEIPGWIDRFPREPRVRTRWA